MVLSQPLHIYALLHTCVEHDFVLIATYIISKLIGFKFSLKTHLILLDISDSIETWTQDALLKANNVEEVRPTKLNLFLDRLAHS